MRPRIAAAALGLALSGCTAAQTNAVIVQGQLFCAKATANGPLVVAIVDAASGAPVSVLGQTAQAVSAICGVVNAIPVAPPASPSAAPVVAVDTSAVRAQLMRR